MTPLICDEAESNSKMLNSQGLIGVMGLNMINI